ncbi:MAG TPA: hypothetical protein VF680_11610 [Allosphingosinicella sp.]
MSTRPPSAAAARNPRADFRSSASAPDGATSGRRPPHSRSGAMLEQLSSRLDVLIRDVSFGARSQGEHERHVEEGEAIAAGIRACFRAPTHDPYNPPLWHKGGKAAW